MVKEVWTACRAQGRWVMCLEGAWDQISRVSWPGEGVRAREAVRLLNWSGTLVATAGN